MYGKVGHLAAQPPEGVVNHPVAAVVVFFPYLFKDLFTGECGSPVVDKQHQQVELFGGQFDLFLSFVDGTLVFIDLKLALYAAIVMVVLEGIDDFLLTPLIVGRSMSFKPIIVLLMTIGISLAGGTFFGVLFAIPAIAIVKLFLDIFWFKKGLENQRK